METIDIKELWVRAPHGFRPSNWVDMLCDFDVGCELDPYCVDRRSYAGLELLTLQASLLDPLPEHPEARRGLFWEMLNKAARLGLFVHYDETFPAEFPDWWTEIEKYCVDNCIQISTRAAMLAVKK